MLIIDIKDNPMNSIQRQVCLEYWSEFGSEEGHLSRVKRLSEEYDVSTETITNIIFMSEAYLDDVVCYDCGMNSSVYAPEEIAERRSQSNWMCEVCLEVMLDKEEN